MKANVSYKLTLACELMLKQSRPYQSVRKNPLQLRPVLAGTARLNPGVTRRGEKKVRMRIKMKPGNNGGKTPESEWSRADRQETSASQAPFFTSDVRSLKGRKEENDASVHTHAPARARAHTHTGERMDGQAEERRGLPLPLSAVGNVGIMKGLHMTDSTETFTFLMVNQPSFCLQKQGPTDKRKLPTEQLLRGPQKAQGSLCVI